MAAEFLAQYFWWIFLGVFLAGTALLWRTRHQRGLIFFMIRTKHGIRWLDTIGKLSPRMWMFLGDLATIVSFGGIGAVYVSKYRSPGPFMIILGAIALLLLTPMIGPVLSGAFFLLLLAAVKIADTLPKRWRPVAFFVIASIIMFSAIFSFAQSLHPGPASLLIAGITGVFGLPGLLVGALASQASSIIFQESALPGVSPLLPGISSSGEIGFMFPGFDIFIPLWSGLAALIILLVSHEFCHGILARVQGIPVKNMGLLTAGIIPIGAFVEPDEKVLERKRSEQKMRVYAMGSFANLVVAGVATILLFVVLSGIAGMVATNGVEIISVQEGFPADVLEPGTVIYAINGEKVVSLEEYIAAAGLTEPGGEIELTTNRGDYTLTSVANPNNQSRAFLGFNLQTHTIMKPELTGQEPLLGGLETLASALGIIFFLNFNVAIVNLLPIVPFDGSKMFDELLKSFKLKAAKRKKIVKWVVSLVLLLLIINALPLGRLLVGG